MRRGHELGQRWVAEDGVVGEADGGDVEVNQLRAEVVVGTEVTGSRICPKELDDLPPTPEKGRLGCSRSRGMLRRLKASTESTLRPAPPSMRVLVTAT